MFINVVGSYLSSLDFLLLDLNEIGLGIRTDSTTDRTTGGIGLKPNNAAFAVLRGL